MRIYISGPITGRTDYAAKFREAAEILADRGFDYVNPAELPKVAPGLGWADYIKFDLQLMDACDAITFLSGSTNSRGCQKEAVYARGKGLPIYDMSTGRLRND